MNSAQSLARIRKFLLIISAGVFIMTVMELFFLSHWTETIQLLPFLLSGLGLVTLFLVYFRPHHITIKFLRWSMIVIGLCSLIGIYEHMDNNLGFQMEIQPSATTWELIMATLEGGNPVLAPGILTLGAVIGWTAAYQYSP
jgi:glucan phosphoethanolaminetransferase (alkaline phosphatase superfamily)